jgi:NAD(P)-dependent dehydrogenase (short-subunit alcohol dehydrogenase family)
MCSWGLALTRHLVAKGWKVDITKYDEQATFFDEVWRWGGGRLDVLAANAGLGEK